MAERTLPAPEPGCAVLVTGGAGFIGSHLSDGLVALGHRVVVLDDLSTGDLRRITQEVRFVKGDVREAGLDALLREERVDTVFHLAAQVDVRRSVADPVFDADVNVLGTIRVAVAAAAAGVRHVVFASSGGAIYGDPIGEKADEDHPLHPCSAYGAAKLAGEKYLEALAPEDGYALTVLRFANVYGPRQDGTGEAGVIGIWMNRLLGGEDAVINGDGSQTRDFVHVSDVVRALQSAFQGRITGTFNVGTGVETRISTLYRLVATACGSGKAPRHAPAKPGEQRRSVLDPTRMVETLGVHEPVELSHGLNATAEWFRLHRAGQGLGNR